jgi:hypothetical protein
MKIKDVIKMLEEYDPEAEIIYVGQHRDGNATIPYIGTEVKLKAASPLLKHKLFIFEYDYGDGGYDMTMVEYFLEKNK